MDLNRILEPIIAQYELIEIAYSDSLSILKEKMIERCISSINPIRPGEDKYAKDYISQAVANLEGMKGSEFLRMFGDFYINLAPLLATASDNDEQLEQEVVNFHYRHQKNFSKLKIAKGLSILETSGVVWHSFFALALYFAGNLYVIMEGVQVSREIITANLAGKNALKENAKKGGLNNVRAQSYQVARKRAYELYQQGTFKNLNRAAKAILPTLKKEGLTTYLTGEEESQYKTVRHWLKKQFGQKA